MLSRTGALVVFGLMLGLGLLAVVLSIVILRKGRLYYRINPESRPRRWVLISLLALFGSFIAWFPVWMTWPNLIISRLLSLVFGLTFFIVVMALKWFSPIIDWYVKRTGRSLR
jgi:hypothetical protein